MQKLMRPTLFLMLADDDNKFENGIEVLNAAAVTTGVQLVPVKMSQFEPKEIEQWVEDYMNYRTEKANELH